ncbi:MAG: ABC transporter permease [Thermoanaerobaculia bacterium]|nr:ABC transporter permease [Thermoanaerobaculia bacterium]
MKGWLRSYALMTSWELRNLRVYLPLALIVQVLIGGGMVIGFGFLIGDLPPAAALYLVCGVAVVSMITIGLVLSPQLIAQQKMAGTYDYLWSLPVPRTTTVASNLTVNTIIALPGMAVALLLGAWRYDIAVEPSLTLAPATLLTLVTAASVGMALAHAIPNPMVTGLVTQILVFFILLFSPINFPPERLPDWFAAIHLWLPFQHSANVIRAGLTADLAADVGFSFAVLGAWALASWLVTGWVVGRRA